MREYIEAFCRHLLFDKGLCPDTVANYRHALDDYTEYLAALRIPSLCSVERDTVAVYYRIIAEKRNFAGSTVHKKTHAVYTFYEWLRKQGVILVNPCPLQQAIRYG